MISFTAKACPILGKNRILARKSHMAEVEAKRGEYHLHNAETVNREKKDLEFLHKKFKRNCIEPPSVHVSPKGFPQKKKHSIMKSLINGKDSIIPKNRHQFWKDLPETGVSYLIILLYVLKL